jgi:hypothetical protein
MIAVVIIPMLAWGWLIYRNKGLWVVDRMIAGPLFFLAATSPLGIPFAVCIRWNGKTLIDWMRRD